MRLVNNALAAMVAQALDDLDLSVRDGATRCGIGLGLMSNILYARTQRPRPETLEALASGLDLPYRALALAAYGIVHDTPAPAKEVVAAGVS